MKAGAAIAAIILFGFGPMSLAAWSDEAPLPVDDVISSPAPSNRHSSSSPGSASPPDLGWVFGETSEASYLNALTRARELISKSHKREALSHLNLAAKSKDTEVLRQTLAIALELREVPLVARVAEAGKAAAPEDALFSLTASHLAQLQQLSGIAQNASRRSAALKAEASREQAAIARLDAFIDSPTYTRQVVESVTCSACDGRGRTWGGQAYTVICKTCHGRKVVRVRRTVEATRDVAPAIAERRSRMKTLDGKSAEAEALDAECRQAMGLLEGYCDALRQGVAPSGHAR